jgi:hypothetical protein
MRDGLPTGVPRCNRKVTVAAEWALWATSSLRALQSDEGGEPISPVGMPWRVVNLAKSPTCHSTMGQTINASCPLAI